MSGIVAAIAASAPSNPSRPLLSDDFLSDTSIYWERAGESVDGTYTVTGGSLVYTVGAGDGAQPRIVLRLDAVTAGERYRATIPAATGTVSQRETYISADGGDAGERLTSVAQNAALSQTFVVPANFGDGMVWVVLRAGTGAAAGETVGIASWGLTLEPYVATGRDILDFDGVDDYVSFAAPAAQAAETISLDIKLPADMAEGTSNVLYCQSWTQVSIEAQREVGASEAFLFAYGYVDNTVFNEHLNTYANSGNTGVPFPLGEWRRYTLTRTNGSPGAWAEYLDGEQIRTGTTSGTLFDDGDTGLFGGYNNTATGVSLLAPARVQIANVRHWSRVLTEAELRDQENTTAGLIGEWLMDEGTGSTVTDSGGSSDGTIIGATWTTEP